VITFWKITVSEPEEQMQTVDFVETLFTGLKDVIVDRCSVAKNGLPRNDRFHLQGNLIKVNRI
jgi:hypothetical protein